MSTDTAFSLAALAIGVLAVFNGLGKILAGWLSDKIGRQKAMLFAFGRGDCCAGFAVCGKKRRQSPIYEVN